jgi:hypothetical protein
MSNMRKWAGALAVVASVAAFAPHALAQDDDSKASSADDKKSDDAETKADDDTKTDKKKDDSKAGEAAAVADAEAGNSPVELPGKTYRFVGLRYRGIIIPKFMMNLFGDGGATTYNHAFGPEFAVRKDGFEYVFSLWWAGYYMDDTPFKASNDPNTAWEIVKSNLSVLYLTTDFLWSQELGPQFAVNYGMGAGFGFVFGSLERTQAYPPGGNSNLDPYQWRKCSGPLSPDPTNCGRDNDHYNGYTEPSWANGGSKPIIFPWLVLQTGVRYKPSRNFVARLDAGFGTSGFFIGLGADYGL